MDAEQVGGLAQVPFGPGQRPSDEAPLNGLARVIIEHALLQHFVHKAVELVPHASLSFLQIGLGEIAIIPAVVRGSLGELSARQDAECLEIFFSRLFDDLGW